MTLASRVIKLESKSKKAGSVTLHLPDWLSESEVTYESKHCGDKDIKPPVPDYIEEIL